MTDQKPNPIPPGATLGEKRLVIAIISASDNRERRNLIRTILDRRIRPAYPKWSFFFAVGQQEFSTTLKEDVLYVNCFDSFETLPQKTFGIINHFLQETDGEYLFKTDDDCFINTEKLAYLRHWNRDYFGLASGTDGHSRDYHFGKARGVPKLDTTEYLGPWAHGSGYCLSRKGCAWLAETLSWETVRNLIFEDKMVGDTMRVTCSLFCPRL